MNERKLIGVSVCLTYVVLIAACHAYVRLGFATSCHTQVFVLELPIWIQLGLAKAMGLYPALIRLSELTHWTVPYAIVVSAAFYPLYWIGWWIARLDEEALATAQMTVPVDRQAQSLPASTETALPRRLCYGPDQSPVHAPGRSMADAADAPDARSWRSSIRWAPRMGKSLSSRLLRRTGHVQKSKEQG